MAVKGIKINNKHSYRNFGLRMTGRSIGGAKRQEHIERVPFSNVVYNFDSLFSNGISYEERVLKYTFELLDNNVVTAESSLMNILEWLQVETEANLYDDFLPNHHFIVREPFINHKEEHGVYTITVQFSANPIILSNTGGES